MFLEGQQIGLYTLIRKLGEGGFGEVWLGENRSDSSSEKVAIKLPRKEQIDLSAVKDETFNWLLSGKHKNILPIIECEIFGNQIAIVSEFAPDGSLQDLLKKQGALSIANAVEIIIGILDGLAHLHKRKIIHRDLKPDNVLFQGRIPRLTDFGISRAMPIDSQSNTVTGTRRYMAPEAFDGKRNVQTDIWSVGVILYQLLSGNLPFPQRDETALMFAIVTKDFAPLPDSVPPVLQYIVKKSLAKESSERYQTADEMREALRNTLSPQKFVESQTSSQAETLVLEDSDKTAKLEIAPVQEATPIIEDNERETELLNVQPEIKTTVRQQIREASERIGKDIDKTEQLVIEPTQDWREIEVEKQRQRERIEKAEKIKNLKEKIENNNRVIENSQRELEGIESRLAERKRLEFVAKAKKAAIGIGFGVLAVMILGGLIWTFSSNSPSDVATNEATNTTSTNSSNPNTFKNSIGMEFVKIPSGSFMMGSENGDSDEKPVHKVTISNDFYMGKYEVTQAQWKAIMGSLPTKCDFGSLSGEFVGDNKPIICVSWEDAQEFIKKLNTKDGETYRLPTEAEWEYAARAGTMGDYAGDLDSMGWYGNNSGNRYLDADAIWKNDKNNYVKRITDNHGHSHPVGQKQPNTWGLYDMHGNVEEWCQDWIGEYPSGAVTNPTGATLGLSRVNRGGTWNTTAGNLRSASRTNRWQSYRNYLLGFRVVRN